MPDLHLAGQHERSPVSRLILVIFSPTVGRFRKTPNRTRSAATGQAPTRAAKTHNLYLALLHQCGGTLILTRAAERVAEFNI